MTIYVQDLLHNCRLTLDVTEAHTNLVKSDSFINEFPYAI